MKHIPPQPHKKPIYTDHLPLVQSHNMEPRNQLSHRLLANMKHWQGEEIASKCGKETPKGAFWDMCTYVLVFCWQCCYLHVFVITVLLSISVCHWIDTCRLSLLSQRSNSTNTGHKRRAEDPQSGDNVCLCTGGQDY